MIEQYGGMACLCPRKFLTASDGRGRNVSKRKLMGQEKKEKIFFDHLFAACLGNLYDIYGSSNFNVSAHQPV